MRQFLHRLHRIVDHAACQLSVGLLILASAVAELRSAVEPASGGVQMRLHHGMLALGLYHVLVSLPPLIDGLTKSSDALDQLHEKRGANDAPNS